MLNIWFHYLNPKNLRNFVNISFHAFQQFFSGFLGVNWNGFFIVGFGAYFTYSFFIFYDNVINAFSTFWVLLADVSIYYIPIEAANLIAYSFETSLVASLSDLFPISILTIFWLEYFSASSIQFSMSMKDFLSEISKTSKSPWAPL